MEKLLSMVFYGADNEETFKKQAIYIVNNMLIYGKIKFELRDIYLEAIKKQFVKHRCVYSSGSHYELCEFYFSSVFSSKNNLLSSGDE
jgi:hypothetical protein